MSFSEPAKPKEHLRDRKGGLSCAECRRSKLRCDRTFPCQACIRRGCAAICPDGVLTATKGNKVLKNQNQTLQEQLKHLKTRVQELEGALRSAHSQVSSQPHQLLQSNESEPTPEPLAEVDEGSEQDANANSLVPIFGALSIGEHNESKYHGGSAGSEYLQRLLGEEDMAGAVNANELGLPASVISLYNAFPFGINSMCPNELSTIDFWHARPNYDAALELASAYYEHASWMWHPMPQGEFMNEIMNIVYPFPPSEPDWEKLHCHQMSVFFIILAIGSLYVEDGWNPHNAVAKRYYVLACASLSLSSLEKDVNCSALQSLMLTIFFLFLTDRSSGERRWLLTGVTGRLTITMGLQLDSAIWKLPADEAQRRRLAFWEYYTWDNWTSLVFGRPPTSNIMYADCRFAEDTELPSSANGVPVHQELGFHAWKHRYAASCLSRTVRVVFSSKPPPYSEVMELDKQIRKFPIPSALQCPTQGEEGPDAGQFWSNDPLQATKQFCALCLRESNLFYIHRSYVVKACQINPHNPVDTKYGASVFAAFRSGCILINSLKGLYKKYPKRVGRIWFFWSSAFSVSIFFGAFVVRAPGCPLASNCLLELERAIAVYDEGSRQCRSPVTLEVLTKLQDRSLRAYAQFHAAHGGSPNSRIKLPSVPIEKSVTPIPDPKIPDLRVFGGMSVVVKKSSSHPSSPETQNTDSPEPPTTGDVMANTGDGRGQGQGSGKQNQSHGHGSQDRAMGSPASGENGVWGQNFMDSLMSTDPVVTTALMESFPSYYPDTFNYPSSAQSSTFSSNPTTTNASGAASVAAQSPVSFGNAGLGTPASGFTPADFDYAALGPLPEGGPGSAGVSGQFTMPTGPGQSGIAPTAEEVWRHFLGDLDIMHMDNQAV